MIVSFLSMLHFLFSFLYGHHNRINILKETMIEIVFNDRNKINIIE